MVILNFYGKIDTICISEKLKIYISNLPNKQENNWNESLVEDMLQEIKEHAIFSEKYGRGLKPYDLKKICSETLGINKYPPNMSDKGYLQLIADNLICIYFDYEYDDMPFFDWTTNCFDGRLCEKDYAEMFLKFLQFFIWKNEEHVQGKNSIFPSYIYTTNHDREYNFLLGALQKKWQNSEVYISSLCNWGRVIDKFLVEENDYLQLDYLINAIYNNNEYNAFHLFKVFSLCEMLLVKKSTSGKPIQLDAKLPFFLPYKYSIEEKTLFSQLVRQMRNKIGHGDFIQLNILLEEFAQKYMDGHYNFDYTEYSRLNWIYLHLCCELDAILAKILFLLFTNRDEYEKIRQN